VGQPGSGSECTISAQGTLSLIVLGWFRRRRRERYLGEEPPSDWAPSLANHAQTKAWKDIAGKKHRRPRLAARRGRSTLIDASVATSPAELFAEATAMFFEPHGTSSASTGARTGRSRASTGRTRRVR